jgi:uncharacterized protein YciI
MIGLLASLFTVLPGSQTPSDMVTMQMVFLRVVPGKNPLTPNLDKNYNERHISGLKKLWEEGKAIAVGPFEDDSYAGVVLLNAKDSDQAKDWLKDDPYVKSGYISLDVLPWFFQNVFLKAPKFDDIEKIWFGILQRPKNAPQYPATKLSEMQKGHLENIGKMANDGILAAAGPFRSDEDRRGIFVFFSKDINQIKRAVAVDPLIRGKRLELKLMRWWTSKGTVVQYKAKK